MTTNTGVRTLSDGLFTYNPETGDLCWAIARSNAVKVGVPIRQPKSYKNYIQVRIEGKLTLAHRIIWENLKGPIPDGLEINHINGKKDDNRLDNLELVTHKDNVRHAKRTGLTPRITSHERPVVGYHKVTGEGRYYRSIREAKKHGFHDINASINKPTRFSKGFKWEYL